mmetsp:Transcript_46252/g.122707  ORF Transcript_46252/g.122707 Transcript_46252/m.122707 type:complete len:249 (-) Transcript_46252:1893-2639(-)
MLGIVVWRHGQIGGINWNERRIYHCKDDRRHHCKSHHHNHLEIVILPHPPLCDTARHKEDEEEDDVVECTHKLVRVFPANSLDGSLRSGRLLVDVTFDAPLQQKDSHAHDGAQHCAHKEVNHHQLHVGSLEKEVYSQEHNESTNHRQPKEESKIKKQIHGVPTIHADEPCEIKVVHVKVSLSLSNCLQIHRIRLNCSCEVCPQLINIFQLPHAPFHALPITPRAENRLGRLHHRRHKDIVCHDGNRES